MGCLRSKKIIRALESDTDRNFRNQSENQADERGWQENKIVSGVRTKNKGAGKAPLQDSGCGSGQDLELVSHADIVADTGRFEAI